MEVSDWMLRWFSQQSCAAPSGVGYDSVTVLGPRFRGNHHHVSLSFLTVTSPLPAPAPDAAADEDDDEAAAAPLGAPDAAAAPGPDPAPDAAADAAPAPAPAPPVPSMVETSPCMKAQGGLLGELSNGQRSPLGQ